MFLTWIAHFVSTSCDLLWNITGIQKLQVETVPKFSILMWNHKMTPRSLPYFARLFSSITLLFETTDNTSCGDRCTLYQCISAPVFREHKISGHHLRPRSNHWFLSVICHFQVSPNLRLWFPFYLCFQENIETHFSPKTPSDFLHLHRHIPRMHGDKPVILWER